MGPIMQQRLPRFILQNLSHTPACEKTFNGIFQGGERNLRSLSGILYQISKKVSFLPHGKNLFKQLIINTKHNKVDTHIIWGK